jgi:hypothetical protein
VTNTVTLPAETIYVTVNNNSPAFIDPVVSGESVASVVSQASIDLAPASHSSSSLGAAAAVNDGATITLTSHLAYTTTVSVFSGDEVLAGVPQATGDATEGGQSLSYNIEPGTAVSLLSGSSAAATGLPNHVITMLVSPIPLQLTDTDSTITSTVTEVLTITVSRVAATENIPPTAAATGSATNASSLTGGIVQPLPTAQPSGFSGIGSAGWNATTFSTLVNAPPASAFSNNSHIAVSNSNQTASVYDPSVALKVPQITGRLEKRGLDERQVGVWVTATINGQVVSWINQYDGGAPAVTPSVPVDWTMVLPSGTTC